MRLKKYCDINCIIPDLKCACMSFLSCADTEILVKDYENLLIKMRGWLWIEHSIKLIGFEELEDCYFCWQLIKRIVAM